MEDERGNDGVCELLHYWPVCWYSGHAAWPETQTCPSQAYGSSSGHPYISPAGETEQELLVTFIIYLHYFKEKHLYYLVGL